MEIQFIVFVAGVVLADQLTKLWIMARFLPFEKMVVVPGFFNLVYVTNTGAAFGILAGEPVWWRQLFFITVACTALAVLLITYRHIRARGPGFVFAIGLIAGGAIGNLVDRLRFGAVVDFLDFYVKSYHWPAFNVADSAITSGLMIFLLMSILRSDKK